MTEVTLLPLWDVEKFAATNLKIHTWKHAPLPPRAILPNNPRERADTLFSLIDPIQSPHWNDYILRRKQAEALTQDMMDRLVGEQMDAYLSNLRDAVIVAFSGETGLKEGEWEKIADGISVLSRDVRDSHVKYDVRLLPNTPTNAECSYTQCLPGSRCRCHLENPLAHVTPLSRCPLHIPLPHALQVCRVVLFPRLPCQRQAHQLHHLVPLPGRPARAPHRRLDSLWLVLPRQAQEREQSVPHYEGRPKART